MIRNFVITVYHLFYQITVILTHDQNSIITQNFTIENVIDINYNKYRRGFSR